MPQEPCFHCGSSYHSIYTCKDYHDFYYDYYMPKSLINKNHTVSTCQTVKKVWVPKNQNIKVCLTEPKTVWVPKGTN